MNLTKTPVFLHCFSKFMGILLFVLKHMYISLLLKMINGFSWPAKIMVSPFNFILFINIFQNIRITKNLSWHNLNQIHCTVNGRVLPINRLLSLVITSTSKQYTFSIHNGWLTAGDKICYCFNAEYFQPKAHNLNVSLWSLIFYNYLYLASFNVSDFIQSDHWLKTATAEYFQPVAQNLNSLLDHLWILYNYIYYIYILQNSMCLTFFQTVDYRSR